MILVKEGSIFNTTAPVIAHQVNCAGIMGAGLAKQIKLSYPEAYKTYCGRCELYRVGITHELLGTIDETLVDDGRTIVNCYAQEGFGTDRRYTDYSALKSCLTQIKARGHKHIALPYKIGCGLAGGDWCEVEPIIKELFGDENEVICELWRLPGSSLWDNSSYR